MSGPLIAKLRRKLFRSRPATILRHIAVVAITVVTSLTLVAMPAYAGTLTTMSLAVSNLQTSTTSKYDWGFRTATLGTLTRVTATVPAGTSAAGRYLGLAANNSNTNNAEAPDSVANSVTGAMDLRANIAPLDWTPGWAQVIMMKWNGSPNYSFIFTLDTSGVITIGRSADGSATTFASSTVATGFTDGTAHWVRATYLPDDGAGNRVTTFYTSTDGVSWTMLGTAVSQSGTGNIYDSTSPVDVGGSGGQAFAGKIYYAEQRSGINGRVVLSMDPGDVTAALPSTWTSKRTQEVWTLTRTGSDLKADISADLVINAVTGIPSTGTAVLRMTDSLVLYSFTATSVAASTTSTLKVYGIINTATAGSFTSTITTYDNSATPVSVDSGSPAAVILTQSVATPNFVQKVTNTSTTGATITGLLPSNTAVGDMLVAALTWNSSVGTTWTCSDNLGNVYTNGPIATVGASTQSTAICYAPVSVAGATTITVTYAGSTNKKGLVFSEYSGVANVNPVDVSASNNATGTTTANAITSTAATTTTNNDLIFGVVGNATAAANTASAGTSFTLRGDVTVTAAHDFVNEDRVLATAGSQAATFTYSTNSQAYGAVMVAFKPAVIATPAFVTGQKAKNGASANTTTISATFPGSTTVGDIIVAGVSFDYSSSPTFTCSDNSGSNTYTTVATGAKPGDQASGICYAVVTTAGSSIVTMTTSVSAAFKAIHIAEYSGVNTNSPFDVGTGTWTTGTTAANNISSGNVTSNWSNELIFGAIENSSNAAASVTAGTTSAAFTIRNQGLTSSNSAGIEFNTEDGVTSAAGSVAATMTYGHTGETYEAAMATFRPAILGTPAVAVYGQAGVYTTNSPTATSTGMSGGGNSATDPIRHRLFVTDFSNNRVLVFNCDTRNVPLDATADFVIGQSSFTANGAAITQSGLNGPNGIVYDSVNSRVYVVDQSANRVMVYDGTNISSGMNASYVIGQSSYTSSATTTDNATLSTPQDLYFDGVNNRLYVGDKAHNRILVFSTASISNGMAATFVLGQSGFGTNSSATTSTGLWGPIGISLDQVSGYLWVGDSINNRVVGYNTASLASGMAATYVLGQSSLTAGTGGTSQSRLSQPAAVAAAPGVLFVSDVNNQRVMRFNTTSVSNGMNASGVYGQGNYVSVAGATSQNGFNLPWGIRYDNTQGLLWVADFGNSRVLQFNVDNSPSAPSSLAQYQSNGSTSISTGAAATSATTVFKASTTDADATDSERLCVEVQPVTVSFTGIDTACGTAVTQGNTASATVTTLVLNITYHWQARLVDSSGTYSNYTSYGSNSDNLTADADFLYSTGRQADYVMGQSGSYTTNGSGLTASTLTAPVSPDIDSVNHRLFVPDQNNNRTLVYNLNSSDVPLDDTADNVLGQANFTSGSLSATQSGEDGPNAVAYDSVHNRLFVVDENGNRVLVYNTSSITNGMNAAYVLGQSSFTATGTGITSSTLNNPGTVAYDGTHDRLFVSDTTNNRVLVYDTSSLSNGKAASYVIGEANFTTNTGGFTQATLNAPDGVAYDSSTGYLYVSDLNANRVMTYNTASLANGMNATNVLGQANFASGASSISQNRMNLPGGVSVGPNVLFVGDVNNSRVLQFNTSSITNGMNASAVFGQSDYTSGGIATTRSGVKYPWGPAYDIAQGKLFLGDYGNNRVLSYYLDNAPSAISSLAQYQSDGTTSIATGGTTNSNTAAFAGTVTDTDTTDTDGICVELQPTSTAFTGTPTACGSLVAQGGTASVTISTLVLGTNYHWQARTVDNSGAYSAWTSFGGNSDTVTAATDIYYSAGIAADYVYGQAGSYTTATAATTSTGMSGPNGVAVDTVNHRMFVADFTNNRVLVFNLDSSNNTVDATADNVLGQANFTASTNATTQGGMWGPYSLAFDGVHNRLFVSDITNNRILVYNTSSITNGMNASYVLGQAGFTTATTGTTQSTLNGPRGIAYDGVNNRLFVTDYYNSRALVYNVTTPSNGMNASYVLGQANFTASANSTSQSGLGGPEGAAFDGSRYVYIADSTKSRVLSYDTNSLANGMNASYVLGQSLFTTASSAVTQSGMTKPVGISASSTTLYVADETANRVTSYNIASISNGMNATTVWGQPSFTTSAAATTRYGHSVPEGIAFDTSSGKLYVADSANNRTLVYYTDNAPLSPSSPTQYKSDASTVVSTGAWNNSTTTVFKAGVTDSDSGDTVSICVEAKPIATTFTNVETSCGTAISSGGTASVTLSSMTEGGEYHWQVRTMDSSGVYSAWVSYGGNSDSVPAAVDVITGVGIPADVVLGQPDFTTGTVAATLNGMTAPVKSAIDTAHHRLFVADTNASRVLVYNMSSSNVLLDTTPDYVIGQTNFTSNSTGLTQSTMSGDDGIAYDPVGDRLFIADYNNNRVLVYNTSSITNGMNAAYVLGQANFTSNTSSLTQSGTTGPNDVEFDSINNRLFVADTYKRVLVYNASSVSNGMNAAYVIGQANFTSNTSSVSQGGLTNCDGLGYDATNNRLFVSDYTSNRITVYNVSTISNGMNASYVIGQANFTSSGSGTTQSTLNQPNSLVVTSTGIYVADHGNNRVLRFDATAVANGMNASAVYGQGSYTTGGAATTRTTLSGPSGVVLDTASGKLYVTDSNNSRVLVYYVDNAPSTPTSLTQYQSNGSTSITTGSWYNASTMVFKGATSDTDATDTNSLCVEIQPVSTAFTNTETACGTAITQGGTASVTISGLTTNTLYHWQARTTDSYGVYSTWSSYGGNSDTVTAATDVGIDTTVPSTAAIYDGSSVGVDAAYNNGLLTTLSGNWTAFTDTSGSGIASYTYSITTAANSGTTILAATTTGSTSFTASTLSLQTSQMYYINVYATDAAGNNSTTVSSNGQLVAPTLTFSLSTSSIQFAHLNSGNSYTDSQSMNVTTSTNGYGGYVVRQTASGALTSGAKTVANYAGTYATPTTWSGTGVGYTSSDTSIQGSGNLFNSGTKYAAWTTSSPGDIVADHTATVTGTPITNEAFTLTYKIAVPSTQAGGTYSTTLRLSATVII